MLRNRVLAMFAGMSVLLMTPHASAAAAPESGVTSETVTLDGDPGITLRLAYHRGTVEKHPVILMLGDLKPDDLPAWSTGLVREGYMLCAFTAHYPPDPDPARRPVWLFFDQRFAHSYVLGGYRAPRDAGRVIDYLVARGDVHPKKIGWMGSSSTGIPGLSVATQEPRLACVVAFVSTGAYKLWIESWHTNKLWRGETPEFWPETLELLKEHDPILHVAGLFPKAILLVSGGDDKVVDPKTAEAFMAAARPYYEKDPERLRLVIYNGFGHNLPIDVVKMYVEHWFHLYMNPDQEPPKPVGQPKTMQESVTRTQINAADHGKLMAPGSDK